jgi:phosphatidylserine decarboxylase
MIQWNTIRDGLPNVHREGWPFIGIALVVALVAATFVPLLFWPLIILAGWMAIFFRDPVRVVPTARGLVVSPADGRVETIMRAALPPELGLDQTRLTRVSIFMNIFDCHINRAPTSGRVARIAYKPGKFLSADLDKASEANERNSILIEADNGHHVGVVQIAGLVARRIVCWARDDASVSAGQRIGMIRFGSRLDVYLPEGSTVTVSAGQRAIAGETLIAVLPGVTLAPPFPSRSD